MTHIENQKQKAIEKRVSYLEDQVSIMKSQKFENETKEMQHLHFLNLELDKIIERRSRL